MQQPAQAGQLPQYGMQASMDEETMPVSVRRHTCWHMLILSACCAMVRPLTAKAVQEAQCENTVLVYSQCTRLLSNLTVAMQVACGNHHTVAITRRGHMITWGMGTSGQTGHGTHGGDVRCNTATDLMMLAMPGVQRMMRCWLKNAQMQARYRLAWCNVGAVPNTNSI
jgi:Regulator of chromosome condensation (RCC1) repeat